MIIITGSGRSGTSITARLFELCGFSLGPDVKWIKRVRAGYEASRVARLNDEIISEGLWAQSYASEEKLEQIALKYKQRLNQLASEYSVCKDPRFTTTLEVWLRAGVKPELVIVCLRRPEECIESAKETGAGFSEAKRRPFAEMYNEYIARMGKLFCTLHANSIPFSILRYSNYVEDFKKIPLRFPASLDKILEEHFQPTNRSTSTLAEGEDGIKRQGDREGAPRQAAAQQLNTLFSWEDFASANLQHYEVPIPFAGVKKIRILFDSHLKPHLVLQRVRLVSAGECYSVPLDAQSALIYQRMDLVGEISTGLCFAARKPRPWIDTSDFGPLASSPIENLTLSLDVALKDCNRLAIYWDSGEGFSRDQMIPVEVQVEKT